MAFLRVEAADSVVSEEAGKTRIDSPEGLPYPP